MNMLVLLLAVGTLVGCSRSQEVRSQEALSRADSPIFVSEASRNIDLPLPRSATNIYYLDYAGGLQDLERFIRFTVPPPEVDGVVDQLVAANNRQFQRTLPHPRT
jgi:hypothetical protein